MSFAQPSEYTTLATNAITGLNAPTYEQLADALERAQAELADYAEDEEQQIKQIDAFVRELQSAAELFKTINDLHLDEQITLPEWTATEVADAMARIDRLI